MSQHDPLLPFEYTRALLRHVFGDVQAGLDYLKLLVCTAERLPVLVLEGGPSSGKTTFLKFLLDTIGPAVAQILPMWNTKHINDDMGGGLRLVAADEVTWHPTVLHHIKVNATSDLDNIPGAERRFFHYLPNRRCYVLTTSMPWAGGNNDPFWLKQLKRVEPLPLLDTLLAAEREALLVHLRGRPLPVRHGRLWINTEPNINTN